MVTGGENRTLFKKRAQGDVTIPARASSRLELGMDFFKDPTLLRGVAPDSFDMLILRMSSIDDSEEGLVDNALAHIGHLTGLQCIYLDRSDASDKGLSCLKSITNLRLIEATGCLSHGAALKDLVVLKELRNLRIGGGSLDQENLRYLSSFPKLEQLALTRCGLTAKGLKYVSQCPSLVVLQLGQNRGIGDSEMRFLMPLKKLAILELGDTSVTVNGLAILQNRINLLRMITPKSAYSAADLARLHKIFPLAQLKLSSQHTKDFSAEDANNIFSPISKDKGL